jgi:hypothetical protein
MSKGFELPAPFWRSIAKSLNSDAARRPAFDRGAREVRCDERERYRHVYLTQRRPRRELASDRICTRILIFWTTVMRDLGPAPKLYRIESQRLKLPAPFSRRVAQPLNLYGFGAETRYSLRDQRFWITTRRAVDQT